MISLTSIVLLVTLGRTAEFGSENRFLSSNHSRVKERSDTDHGGKSWVPALHLLCMGCRWGGGEGTMKEAAARKMGRGKICVDFFIDSPIA
jgi:hypothetical protein